VISEKTTIESQVNRSLKRHSLCVYGVHTPMGKPETKTNRVNLRASDRDTELFVKPPQWCGSPCRSFSWQVGASVPSDCWRIARAL
jgi:hypothetical protein